MSAAMHQRSRFSGKIDARAKGPGLGSIGALLAWYQADTLTTPNATAITSEQWTDSSGNGNTLTKSAGTGPTMRDAYWTNGHRACQMTGASCWKASTRLVPLTEFTIIAVIDWAGSGRMIGVENSGSGSAGLVFYQGTTVLCRGGSAGDITVAWATGKQIVALQMGVGGTNAWKNGVKGNGHAGTTYGDAAVTLSIGGAGTTDSFMTGHIGEFAIFNSRLSDADVGLAFAHLNAKYGIY